MLQNSVIFHDSTRPRLYFDGLPPKSRRSVSVVSTYDLGCVTSGHQKELVKSEDRRPRGGEQWKKEREQLGWTSWSQARTQAQNSINWHHRIKALCASGREAKKEGVEVKAKVLQKT